MPITISQLMFPKIQHNGHAENLSHRSACFFSQQPGYQLRATGATVETSAMCGVAIPKKLNKVRHLTSAKLGMDTECLKNTLDSEGNLQPTSFRVECWRENATELWGVGHFLHFLCQQQGGSWCQTPNGRSPVWCATSMLWPLRSSLQHNGSHFVFNQLWLFIKLFEKRCDLKQFLWNKVWFVTIDYLFDPSTRFLAAGKSRWSRKRQAWPLRSSRPCCGSSSAGIDRIGWRKNRHTRRSASEQNCKRRLKRPHGLIYNWKHQFLICMFSFEKSAMFWLFWKMFWVIADIDYQTRSGLVWHPSKMLSLLFNEPHKNPKSVRNLLVSQHAKCQLMPWSASCG